MVQLFFSTNVKNIEYLYLIFALFLGMITSAFYILIKLVGPEIQYLQGDNQLYNIIVTAYTFITIFFLVRFSLINQFKIVNKLTSLGSQFFFCTSIFFNFMILPLGAIFIMAIVQDFKFLQNLSEMFNFYYFNEEINLFYSSLNSLPFIQDPTSEFYLGFLPGLLLQKEITPEISLRSSENLPDQLNPHYVTGFCDAESSFIVSIRESQTNRIAWKVEAKFQIGLNSKDTEILYKIQEIFKGG